ncbi:MAG: SusC/RagA family TonB-linked outer membrane protein [Bacteroidota bacterium]|nr:SusC/RagA family TonB-linked outer membrane protein [Bacteroidota bacterium]
MKKRIRLNNRIRAFMLFAICTPLLGLSAQEQNIRAVVVDENLEPVKDAYVRVNGTQISETSSPRGVVAFKANASATLLIGKDGYRLETLQAGQPNQYIILRRKPLEEKQPVAFGTVEQGLISSSMNILNGNQLHNSVSNLGAALYGKLPGLVLQQGQSEPGGDVPSYFGIRGNATLGSANNQPMVVVDGFERDMSTIQVEDVDKIAVLKDASATAIYGARGANSVILITTKRGSTGPVKVNASVQMAMDMPTRIPKFLSSYDFASKYSKAYAMDGLPSSALNYHYSAFNIDNYKTGDPYYYPNIDWVKEMTKSSAPHRQADINISGGNDVGRYYVSLNYYGAEGIYDHTNSLMGYSTNTETKQFRFRSNMDVNIAKNWTLKADISGQIDTRNRPMLSATDMWNYFYKTPGNLYPIYVNKTTYGGNSTNAVNPMAEFLTRGYRRYNDRAVMTNVETRYDLSDLIRGVSMGLRFGYDNSYTNREGWDRKYQVQDVLGQDPVTGNVILSSLVGTASPLAAFGPDTDGQDDRMTFEGFTEYKSSFSTHHHLNSMVMYHQDKYILDGNASPYYYQFVGGRVGYDYNKKYFGEFSCSYSGTERFAKSRRFGFFPAISAGWLLSEEDFLKSAKAIDYLKLRASAGLVGNSYVGERFSYIRQYASANGWVFGASNTGASGLAEGTYPNENFSFEKAYKYEAGAEVGLLKNISVSANVYLERRNDILTSSSGIVPAIFGGAVANVNAGTTERKGIEFAASYNKQLKDWGFRAGINGSYNINKILKVNEEPQPESYLLTTGNQINQPFMLECVGFYKDQNDIDNSPQQTFGSVKPGDLKYKDQNNDGKIDNNDRKPFFNPSLPKAELGLDLAVRYKGFELSGFLQSQLGRSVYLGDNAAIFWPLQSGSSRISTFAANSWTPETAETADYPRLTTLGNSNNYRASTFWYRNGDFLRLRTVELSYSLPQSFLSKHNVRNVKLFIRGLDLYTWDHLKIVDPETLSVGYPVMKSFNLGLNLQL